MLIGFLYEIGNIKTSLSNHEFFTRVLLHQPIHPKLPQVFVSKNLFAKHSLEPCLDQDQLKKHPVTILVMVLTNPDNFTNDLLILKLFDGCIECHILGMVLPFTFGIALSYIPIAFSHNLFVVKQTI